MNPATCTKSISLAAVERARVTRLLALDLAALERAWHSPPLQSWNRLSPDDHWYSDDAGQLYWREGSALAAQEAAPWE